MFILWMSGFISAIAIPDRFIKKLHERTVSSSKLRFSIMNVIKQLLAQVYNYILYKIHI